MSSYNKATLVGNLTRDVELKDAGGRTVGNFALALNESYKGKDGEWVDKAVFVDVVAWERLAETCANHLNKGSQVLVEGSLQQDTWSDKESGKKRSAIKVRASRVVFLGAKPQANESGGVPAPSDKAGSDDLPF